LAFSQQNPNLDEAQFGAAAVKPVAPISLDGPYVTAILRGGPGTADAGQIAYSHVGLRGLLTPGMECGGAKSAPAGSTAKGTRVNAIIRHGARKEEVNAML
jgi:hypothetical protein